MLKEGICIVPTFCFYRQQRSLFLTLWKEFLLISWSTRLCFRNSFPCGKQSSIDFHWYIINECFRSNNKLSISFTQVLCHSVGRRNSIYVRCFVTPKYFRLKLERMLTKLGVVLTNLFGLGTLEKTTVKQKCNLLHSKIWYTNLKV